MDSRPAHAPCLARQLATQLVSSPSSPSRPSSSCHRRVCSGLRSDKRSFARPPMPLRRGIPVCAPRAPGGGGSAPARCVLSRTCFLWLPKKSGGVLSYQMKNSRWRPAFALETGGSPNTDGQDFEEDSGFLGRTRLGRLIQAAARQLLEKLNSARSNSPTKIFLVLLGFYTANALATILGQTGDWDILVAGVVVAAIEGIGMLCTEHRWLGLLGDLNR